MLPSASLPCLSRLLKARGAAPPACALEARRTPPAQRSQSEAAIAVDGKNGHGDAESGRGQTTRTRARARPRSADVASRLPGTPSLLSSGPAARVGPEERGVGQVTLSNGAEREGGARPGARIRPLSAPGCRPGTLSGHRRVTALRDRKPQPQQFKGPVTVNTEGGGSAGWRRAQRALLGGWSAQDTFGRNAGELSRGGLICLVRALRQELRAADRDNRVITQHDEAVEVRGATQTTLIHGKKSIYYIRQSCDECFWFQSRRLSIARLEPYM